MSDKCSLYLTTIPEALVASMLPPEEFGAYLAVGTKKRSRGEAMFFSLRPGFQSDWFDIEAAARKCVAHPDGHPKHSVYLGIYRVLEHVPLDALGNLYLVTRDGRVLELQQAPPPPEDEDKYHFYDEMCPVHPLIVSKLSPARFAQFITDPANPVHVPRLCFAELELPDPGTVPNPTYGEHLQDCLTQLDSTDKPCKTFDRIHRPGGWGRRFKNGFFVGDQTGLLFYPFPSFEELEDRYHIWWRSASA